MWIEIQTVAAVQPIQLVTPLAGVWIEIKRNSKQSPYATSLPLRECGLKSPFCKQSIYFRFVTPLAGVWIEIAFV